MQGCWTQCLEFHLGSGFRVGVQGLEGFRVLVQGSKGVGLRV